VTGYSIGSSANLDGPIGFGASFGFLDVDGADSRPTVLSIGGSYDLPVSGIAACPIAGFEWGHWSDSFEDESLEISTYSFPIGLSVGSRVGDEAGVVFLPNARAGLLYMRASFSGSDPEFGDFDESDSETEFFFGGGVTVGFGQFFGNVGVFKSTLDGSDAVFSVGFGMAF
jgi:hypothetical protein